MAGMIIRVNREELVKNRIMSGFSQRSLAREIGISGAYLSQIENGDRNPGPGVAKKIAEALGVNYSDIFFIDNVYKSERKEISKVSAS